MSGAVEASLKDRDDSLVGEEAVWEGRGEEGIQINVEVTPLPEREVPVFFVGLLGGGQKPVWVGCILQSCSRE